MVELPVRETRQVVFGVEVRQPRRTPDMSRRMDRFGPIEAGRAEADQIGAICRWAWMPPENRGTAGWTEVPYPVIRGGEAAWTAGRHSEGTRGSIGPDDQRGPCKSPADGAMTVARVKDLGRLEAHRARMVVRAWVPLHFNTSLVANFAGYRGTCYMRDVGPSVPRSSTSQGPALRSRGPLGGVSLHLPTSALPAGSAAGAGRCGSGGGRCGTRCAHRSAATPAAPP
jgi:hypothetical protein